MTLPSRFLPLALVLILLMAAASATAWHGEDERGNTKFGTKAGDPRVLDDMEPCLEEARSREETRCVAFYAHPFSLLDHVPMNTQIPADCAPDLARGFSGEVHTGQRNQMSLYSSPGFVEYQERKCGGPGEDAPRYHPERGLASDIRLSREVPISAYWYLSADAAEFSPFGIGSGPDEGPSAGILPCVTVQMTLWTKRYPGDGTLIAEGKTTKTISSVPDGTQGTAQQLHGVVEDPCPGAEGTIHPEEVTEFHVRLEPEADPLIPYHEGYVVHVQWYQHDGGDVPEQPKPMQREWNLRSGSEYRNRVVLPVEDPLEVTKLQVRPASPAADDASTDQWIRLDLRSPWGAFDLDTKNIRFSLIDENGKKHTVRPEGSGIHADGCGFPSTRHLHYVLDLEAEGLPPGPYTLQVSAPNWQHTAEAHAETWFNIIEQESPETGELPLPGPALILPVLGLFAGSLKRLRRAGTQNR